MNPPMPASITVKTKSHAVRILSDCCVFLSWSSLTAWFVTSTSSRSSASCALMRGGPHSERGAVAEAQEPPARPGQQTGQRHGKLRHVFGLDAGAHCNIVGAGNVKAPQSTCLPCVRKIRRLYMWRTGHMRGLHGSVPCAEVVRRPVAAVALPSSTESYGCRGLT